MEKHLKYLKRCIEISKNAKHHGNTPFGALLIDGSGQIILEQENIEITNHVCTGHAETALVEKASRRYDKQFLRECTLYTTVEPCVMCTGAIYWSNIGKIVYGLSEKSLLNLTGNDEQNPTFDLPCREVLAYGQKDIEVIGPVSELESAIEQVHLGYW